MRRFFLMSLRASASPGCRQHTSDCYLQIPKTGSTTLKAAFGLPVNLDRDQKLLSETCASILTSVRDPIERFVSGVGTTWRRFRAEAETCRDTGRCLPPAPFGLSSPPDDLDAASFDAYAWRALDAVKNATTCPSWKALRHAQHLLPQWTFIDLACLDAQTPYVLTARDPDALIGETCATPVAALNVREGRAVDAGPSPALRSAVAAFYAEDARLVAPLYL